MVLINVLWLILLSCQSNTTSVIENSEKKIKDTLAVKANSVSNSYLYFKKRNDKRNGDNFIVSNIYGLDSVVYFQIDTISYKESKLLYLPKLNDTLYVINQQLEPKEVIISHIAKCDSINLLFSTPSSIPLNCDFGQFGFRGKVIKLSGYNEPLMDFVFKMKKSFKFLDIITETKKVKKIKSTNQILFYFTKNTFEEKNDIGTFQIKQVFSIDEHKLILMNRQGKEYLYREIYEVQNDDLKLIYTYPME